MPPYRELRCSRREGYRAGKGRASGNPTDQGGLLTTITPVVWRGQCQGGEGPLGHDVPDPVRISAGSRRRPAWSAWWLRVLWAASTEIYVPVDENIHYRLEDLEKAMKADDRNIYPPSMCYAYAALSEGAPFIMGAPNTTVDIPAMWESSCREDACPIAGKGLQDRPERW